MNQLDLPRELAWSLTLDRLLPDGYEIVPPPSDYEPRTTNKLTGAPAAQGFHLLERSRDPTKPDQSLAPALLRDVAGVGELQFVNLADSKHFGDLSVLPAESPRAKVLRLVLNVKNGVPAVRKTAQRQIHADLQSLGPQLMDLLVLLLQDTTLEELERHRIVKLTNKVVLSLGPAITPWSRQLIVAIQPTLIDSPSRISRKEAQELLAAITVAIGLSKMLSYMRADVEHPDEYVRRVTAATLATAATSQDPSIVFGFLEAGCRSHSWLARHTCLRALVYIARQVGQSILGHLNVLARAVQECIKDTQPQVRVQACITFAALAEASNPYGIESLEKAIPSLWAGVRTHRGRGLAAFIRALASLAPLMDPDNAADYSLSVLKVCVQHFESGDDEVKRAILRAIEVTSEFASRTYLRSIAKEYFESFWKHRAALNRGIAFQTVKTTVTLAKYAGSAYILELLDASNVVKDSSPPFQRMGLECIEQIAKVGARSLVEISERLEERLIDSLVAALTHAKQADSMLLNATDAVFTSLGVRMSPYLEPLCQTVVNGLSNPLASQRELAAKLAGILAPIMHRCNEQQLLVTLGTVLNEQLGEENVDVLNACLQGLTSVVSEVGLAQMQPPIRDLLPRLTPILRNPHESIQESCIDLIGKIAEHGAEYANAREWVRICYELIDIFKAPRKSTRRAANRTFGYIAKGIGPQDVLATLITNLRVHDRQSRVSSAAAIGIVAEACEPFTVIPALLNEYRTPDMNVQNSVLKALSFLFEYISAGSGDYLFSVYSLIEHALMEKSQVHRQTASTIVYHIALGCIGQGHEDVFIQFLNLLMPSVFESSPHLIDRILAAIKATGDAVGQGVLAGYVWAGLFHPSRRTRQVYWKIYNSMYIQSPQALVPAYPVDVPAMDVWL